MAKLLAAPRHAVSGRGDYQSPELAKFVSDAMAKEDPIMRRIREETPKRGLPAISIGPDEGKILHFLVRACGAVKAVEVGTLAGYSACWIARALPENGRLCTLEYDPRHAAVARKNLHAAGVAAKTTVHEGPAAKTLPGLEKDGPYDFCFIDADKINYPIYLEWASRHVRVGGIVVADNAYLFGKLHLSAKLAGDDAAGAAAMRKTLALMADTRLFSSCAMLPTGEGLAVAVRA